MSKQGDEWEGAARDASVQRIIDAQVIFLAATGTMVDVSERIWGRGELTDGSKLTYKEDYEVWAYKPPAPRKPSGRGKPNKDGKSKKIKGGYYPTYLAFKGGMDRADLPFELTGDLRLSWFGGAVPAPTELGPLQCAIVMEAAQEIKARGLEAQKGAFLLLNEAEVAAHQQRINEIMAAL